MAGWRYAACGAGVRFEVSVLIFLMKSGVKLLISARSSQTASKFGRSLGWRPRKSDRDFTNHFQTEAEKMMEAKEKNEVIPMLLEEKTLQECVSKEYRAIWF